MSAQVKEGVKPSGAVKVTAKKHKWYLGGIASAMAACVTHPLDLLKVIYTIKTVINLKAWTVILRIIFGQYCGVFFILPQFLLTKGPSIFIN